MDDPIRADRPLPPPAELDPAWADVELLHRDVGGTRVRVLAAGEQGAGPPVVLVHGLGGSATNWLELMPLLAARRRVLALDLPGFGETAPPRSTTPRPAALAGVLATFLRGLDAGPVVLVGNSMGGLVSTLVAGEQPDLVHRLVLLAPSLPQAGGVPRVTKVMVGAFLPMLVPAVGRAVLARRAQRLTAEQRYDDLLSRIVARRDLVPDRMHRVGVQSAARTTELAWRTPSFVTAAGGLASLLVGSGRRRTEAALEPVRVPTLLLWGDRDQLVLRAAIDATQARLADVEVHVLEGVGHVAMLEVPSRTAELVEDFLSRRV